MAVLLLAVVAKSQILAVDVKLPLLAVVVLIAAVQLPAAVVKLLQLAVPLLAVVVKSPAAIHVDATRAASHVVVR
jgi:hypothetical protein